MAPRRDECALIAPFNRFTEVEKESLRSGMADGLYPREELIDALIRLGGEPSNWGLYGDLDVKQKLDIARTILFDQPIDSGVILSLRVLGIDFA